MTNEQMISDRIAAAEKKLAAAKAEAEIELSILRLLPSDCPDSVDIFAHPLYGTIGTVTFKEDDLEWAIANLEPTGIIKTEKGSSFTSFIPDAPECRAVYEKKSKVKGWIPAGRYLFKFSYLESMGKTLGRVQWDTRLTSGQIVSVKVDLKNPQRFVCYSNLEPNARVHKKFSASLRNAAPRIQWMQYAPGEVPGTGDVIAWHPDGLSPSEMFAW